MTTQAERACRRNAIVRAVSARVPERLRWRALRERLRERVGCALPFEWLRLGPEFHAFGERLREDLRAPEAVVRARQFETLSRQVHAAYHGSPFYREHYDLHGFHPRQLTSPDALRRVPPIDKEIVRAQGSRLLVEGAARGALRQVVTSGTTGRPLSLWVDMRAVQREYASILHMWGWLGYRPGEWRLELRGLVPEGQAVVRLPMERAVRANVLALGPQTLPAIVRAAAAAGCAYVHGYPSAIARFCTLLERAPALARELGPLRAVFFASEVLYPHQLAAARATFPGVAMFSHYGQAERIALGGWYHGHERYHFLPAVGFVERCPDAGTLIGTSLANEAAPLIRYRLTDVAEGFDPAPRPYATGLFPVVDTIGGRLEDTTYRADGAPVPPAIVSFPFKRGEGFTACRIVQPAVGQLELTLETPGGRRPDRFDAGPLLGDLARLYGAETRVTLRFSPHLERDRAGKFRWIQCQIPEAERPGARLAPA